ncbi:hypothetical protein KGY64_00320 [Candidatus Bipolaricaulota bacterium]|nr:hypothetical protein [Candidatus Bipolaricaulota bacterium]
MKRIKVKSIVSLLAILLAFFAVFTTGVGVEDTNTLAILHVNDAHGVIEDFDRVSWYKHNLEEKYDEILLVSAGDSFTGNPVEDEYVIDGKT